MNFYSYDYSALFSLNISVHVILQASQFPVILSDFIANAFHLYYLTNTTNPCATSFKVQSLTAYVQVVWLKVELCRLLEEKRAAVLRLEPCSFCIYLVKMKDVLKINE